MAQAGRGQIALDQVLDCNLYPLRGPYSLQGRRPAPGMKGGKWVALLRQWTVLQRTVRGRTGPTCTLTF